MKVCTSVSLLLAFMNLLVPEGTAWAQGRTTQQEADTVFYNGKILTVDENFTVAEALAIEIKVINIRVNNMCSCVTIQSRGVKYFNIICSSEQ